MMGFRDYVQSDPLLVVAMIGFSREQQAYLLSPLYEMYITAGGERDNAFETVRAESSPGRRSDISYWEDDTDKDLSIERFKVHAAKTVIQQHLLGRTPYLRAKESRNYRPPLQNGVVGPFRKIFRELASAIQAATNHTSAARFQKVLKLLGFILSPQTRERIWTPAVNELFEDWGDARKGYRSPGARRWLAIVFYTKGCVMVLDCLRVAAAGRVGKWVSAAVNVLLRLPR